MLLIRPPGRLGWRSALQLATHGRNHGQVGRWIGWRRITACRLGWMPNRVALALGSALGVALGIGSVAYPGFPFMD